MLVPGNGFIRGGGSSQYAPRRAYRYAPNYIDPLNPFMGFGAYDPMKIKAIPPDYWKTPHPELSKVRGSVKNVRKAMQWAHAAVENAAEFFDREGAKDQAMALRMAGHSIVHNLAANYAGRLQPARAAVEYIEAIFPKLQMLTPDPKARLIMGEWLSGMLDQANFTVENRKALLYGFFNDMGANALAMMEDAARGGRNLTRSFAILTNPWFIGGAVLLGVWALSGGVGGQITSVIKELKR